MTLIEIIIYFGLVTLLITGILGTSIAINANAVKSREITEARREGEFLIHVIDNLISFHPVISPTAGVQATALEITESNLNNIKTAVSYEEGKLWLKHGDNPALLLSADSSVISEFKVRLNENRQIILIEFIIHGQPFSLLRAVNM